MLAAVRYKARLSLTLLNNYGRCRYFLTSRPCCDHYKTLGLQPGATKAQIKSHFYQLSKKHHPDVSGDAKSKELFTRMTEAYAVLSNDRERRIYDRSLLSRPGPTPSSHSRHSYPPPKHGYRSRPGATYAWQNTSRQRADASSSHNPHPHTGEFSRRPNARASQTQHTTTPSGHGTHYEPRPQRTGYTGYTRETEEDQALKRVQKVSGLRRATEVAVLIMLSAGLVGAWGK